MWTLVIIVVMGGAGANSSGTSNSIHSFGNLSSKAKCEAAANAIALNSG